MKKKDLLDDMMVVSEGTDSEEDYAKSMQHIINDGTGWRMEGAMGRSMMDALESGICCLGREPQRDYYGNRIPSRFEVQEGTKGSVGFVREKRGADWAKMVEEI